MKKWYQIILFTLLCGLIILSGVMIFFRFDKYPVWIDLCLPAAMLVVVGLIWRSVIIPRNVIRNGMFLMAAQDFGSRLKKVGEPESDRIVSLFNSMMDRLREERLNNLERECFLQLLVEVSPMGIAIADYDGNLTMVNPSFMRLAGLPDDYDVKGKKPAQVASEFGNALSAVELGSSEVISFGDTRRYRLYHNTFIQSGFPREFFMIEELSAEMREAERTAYEKVIRTISHEVNNTMGGVSSLFDLLLEVTPDEELGSLITSCDIRCANMCRFIDSYAEVVRLSDPMMTSRNLNREIRSLIPFFNMSYPGVNIIFNGEDEEEIHARYDAGMIQQVFVNVIKNAMESMKEGKGTVWISIERKRNNVEVDIANDGEPIAPEIAANLFRPFFTTKSTGKGIGLTLVSEILTRHDAHFYLRTYPDGKTHFHITFRK